MSHNTDAPITLGDKLKRPLAGIVVLIICRFLFDRLLFGQKRSAHFLFHADREGFMRSLKLADKTAVFDGSNIYHIGLAHELGTHPLTTLVQNLRNDGYRILCFFDANIYFTLRKNGEFLKGAPFSPNCYKQHLI